MKQNVLEKWIAVGMSLFVAIGLLFLANIMSDGEQVETVSAYEYYPTETQVVGTHLEIKLSSLEVPEGIYRSGDIVEVPFSVSFSERYDYGHWYAGMIKEEGYEELKENFKITVSPADAAEVTLEELKPSNSGGNAVGTFKVKLLEGESATISFDANYSGTPQKYGLYSYEWVEISGVQLGTIKVDNEWKVLQPRFTLTWKDTPRATLLGDADGSGGVGVRDAIALCRFLHKLSVPETFDSLNADMNGDGVLNVVDLVLLRRYLFSI